MATATETRITYRIHRDIFPHTDHGYTWVEYYWFERNGERISPISPCAGCTERLGHMPGGPVGCPETQARDMAYYAPNGYRILKTEETHQGHYRVGTVSIVPINDHLS
jgi:hypothetical protein